MVTKNIISKSLLAIGLASVSIWAYAADGDLTTENLSDKASTAIINGFGCSSDLGAKGITEAGETKTVEKSIIKIACATHPSDCKAEVFVTRNCNRSGASKIATVMFDTKKGIKSITMNSTQYELVGSGFKVTLKNK